MDLVKGETIAYRGFLQSEAQPVFDDLGEVYALQTIAILATDLLRVAFLPATCSTTSIQTSEGSWSCDIDFVVGLVSNEQQEQRYSLRIV